MKSDNRVRFTKECLKDSLISLLKEMPVNKVTVTEICQRAQVNRSTYYKYYADPYDQLDELQEQFFEEIGNYLTYKKPSDYAENGNIAILNYYLENRETMLVLYNSDGGVMFRKKWLKNYWGTIKQIWRHLEFICDKNMEPYVMELIANGTFAVICKWLEEDTDRISAYEIDRLLNKLRIG